LNVKEDPYEEIVLANSREMDQVWRMFTGKWTRPSTTVKN
jgi:hypothetical protein